MCIKKYFFVLVPLLILSNLIVSVGQINNSLEKDCDQYEKLASEVLQTAARLRNNGAFRTNDTAINLLEKTDELLRSCAQTSHNSFAIKLTMAEHLIIRNKLEKADQAIKDISIEFVNRNPKNQVRFSLVQAQFLSAKGKNKRALSLAESALDLAARNKNSEGAAKALWLLGSINEEIGLGDTAIGYYKRSANIGDLKNINDEFILESIMHIGNVSYQKKDYPTALKYYQLGKEKAVESKVSRLVPFSYYHLGKYYFDVEQNEKKALENLKNGLRSVRSLKLDNYFITPIILQKIGVIYYASNNNEKAQEYFTAAIETAEKNGQTRMIPLAYKYLKELENK